MAPHSLSSALPGSADSFGSSGEVREVLTSQSKWESLTEKDVMDLLSPLQLDALLSLGGNDVGSGELSHKSVAAAAAVVGVDELMYLLSPFQRTLLEQRCEQRTTSTMLCGNFFTHRRAINGSKSAVGGRRGAPMLANILTKSSGNLRGRTTTAKGDTATQEQAASFAEYAESSHDSVSSEDSASVNSRASSLSWISDDGRRSPVMTPVEGAASGNLVMSREDGRRASVASSSVASLSETRQASHGGTSGSRAADVGESHSRRGSASVNMQRPASSGKAHAEAAAAASSRQAYSSYKQMPLWEEMAEKTVKRMNVWVSPNSQAPWENSPFSSNAVEVSTTSSKEICASTSTSAPTSASTLLSPSTSTLFSSTLFKKAAAVAANQRAEKQRAAAVAMRGGASAQHTPSLFTSSGNVGNGTFVWPAQRLGRSGSPQLRNNIVGCRAKSPVSATMSPSWATGGAPLRRSASPDGGRISGSTAPVDLAARGRMLEKQAEVLLRSPAPGFFG